MNDAPIPGKQYALTGGPDDKCIANGNTWAESIVKQFALYRDDKLLFEGTEAECMKKLHDTCPGSWEHAMKYEGYSVKELINEVK